MGISPFDEAVALHYISTISQYLVQDTSASAVVLRPGTVHCLDGILGLLKALPKLVSSRSEQLANALHVMVRMLARLLRKIIHPQTIRSVFRGKVLVIKNGTRTVWISKCVLLSSLLDFFAIFAVFGIDQSNKPVPD